MISLIVALLVVVVQCTFQFKGKDMHWAVLISGSSGYYNYRHQADVCHAYHILIENGMPADHIIVFSYDDAANSEMNPFPGTLYNRADNTRYEQVEYYKNCVIDYRSTDVTVANFENVLLGKKKLLSKTRVLKSTSEDNVFINFVDHGADGLIAFPTEELHAKELNSILQQMHDKKMYKNLVFYMEACESGSMFDNDQLPENIEIYAVTAANASESSWGTFCPPDDDIVNGKHLGTCLGDLFSINWMEDTEGTLDSEETLDTQFTNVKAATDKSHVMRFGDMSIDTKTVKSFEGDDDVQTPVKFRKHRANEFSSISSSEKGTVSSRDVTFHILYHNYINAEIQDKPKNFNIFMEALEKRNKHDTFFASFIKTHRLMPGHTNKPTRNVSCYKSLISAFKQYCMNDAAHFEMEYVMQYYTYFKQLCNEKDVVVDAIVDTIKYNC